MRGKSIPIKKYITKYGIILGLATILFSLFTYVSGYYTNQNLFHATILFLITSTSIIIGLLMFKKNNDGYINLKQSLIVGIGISLLGGLLAILWKILLIKVIDPEIITQLENNNIRRIAESSKNFTQENIERKVAITKKATSPFRMISLALVSDLISGTLISLIAGLIIRKKRDPFK